MGLVADPCPLLTFHPLTTQFALLSARLSAEAIVNLTQQASITSILSSHALWKTYGKHLDEASHFVEAPTLDVLRHQTSTNMQDKGDEVDANDCSVAIFHSSGTTGLPKAIYHCHRYMLGYAACHELSPQQVSALGINASTLPLYHGFGLLGPSLSISIGLPILLPSSVTTPSAYTTAKILSFPGVGSLFTVPSIIEDMVLENGGDSVRLLARLRLVVVGGAPIKVSLGERITTAGVPLLNHFGATGRYNHD